jgi:glucose-6-phosphate 1-dehydrogenase
VNHLMQIVGAAAMEPPSSRDPDVLKDAMVGVFRSMPEADPANYIRGQYDGYLKIDGVADDSTTETFAALRLEVDSWRWAGVPFFIRTGKRMPVTQTEVRLVFHRPPRVRFYDAEWMPEPNQLIIRLDPTTGIRILAQAQRGTTMRPEEISLDMEFAEEGGEGPTPYEVLLLAAMEGNSARFTRQDQVEEAWRVLEPLFDSPPPVHGYAPGSWGPKEADELVAGSGRWHEPWMGS